MEEKLESIAKLAQDYLHKVPVIILGCGASAPLGIPPMGSLGDYILATLEPFFKTESYWKPFSDAMLATRNLEKVLFENPYPKVFNDAVVRATWDLITEADLALFCECVSKKRELPLTPIFTKLLQSHPRKIRVVTTNYDRIVEYSSNFAGARFSTGFTGEYIGKFEPEENHFHHSTKCVDICKVHGSLDWFIDSNNIAFSIPPATSIPENSTPLIVTPGLQKFRETHKDPYRSTISKADKFISDAACFLAIGYGFNDEHIQPALIEQINRKKKPIVIVTKELTPEGEKILAATGVAKYLVFSEGTKPEHTKVTTYSGAEEIENIALWQVPEFTKIWIG